MESNNKNAWKAYFKVSRESDSDSQSCLCFPVSWQPPEHQQCGLSVSLVESGGGGGGWRGFFIHFDCYRNFTDFCQHLV